jgi:branched-subunit amino acid aminotransferase/4-amino-4-deoxychorismate lyase
MKCIYNFQLAEETMVSLPLQNRAFQYGDGLFETMRFQEGRILFLEDHLQRLSTGLEVLQMKLPADFTMHYVAEAIAQLVEVNQLSKARIRLQVWRKSGGLYTPSQKEAEFYISVQPFEVAISRKKYCFTRISACRTLPFPL